MSDEGVCSCNIIHDEKVNNVKGKLLEGSVVCRLSEFFKVFSDATRIQMLYVLSLEELCVCDITEVLNMTQSAVSHQLKILRQERLVKYRRDGKTVFYSLDDDHIRQLLNQGLDHIHENKF